MYGSSQKGNFFKSLLIALGDCLMVFLAMLAALASMGEKYDISSLNLAPVIVYAVAFCAVCFGLDMYSIINRKKYDLLLGVLISCCIASVVAMVFDYFFAGVSRTRMLAVVFLFFAFVILSAWRLAVNFFTIKTRGHAKLLVIEAKDIDNALARKIKYSCLDWFDSWYTQINIEDEEEFNLFLKGECAEYENIFITQSIPEYRKKTLVAEAIRMDKNIYMLPSLYDINITKYHMVQFDDTPSFQIKPFRLTQGQRLIKRFFDFAVSLFAVVLTSPIMLIIAAAIRLDSKGPVFYRQERVTRGGKRFMICKFRTMRADAEKMSGPVLAADDDPRITRAGRILRMTRLDELPQLLNILLGDMSIVGPRPERPFFVDQFCDEIDDYDKRLSVKAGLTGYAQVYARYDTDAADKLLYDLIYIREYSFLLDLKIILLTVKTIFTKEASDGVKETPDWQNQSAEEMKK